MTVATPCIYSIPELKNNTKNMRLITVDNLKKPCWEFEHLEAIKPTRPFIDMDGYYKDDDYDEGEFYDISQEIERILTQRFPECGIINRSHFNSEKWLQYQKGHEKQFQWYLDKTEHKFSFRLTNPTIHFKNMKQAGYYCYEEWSKEIKEALHKEKFDRFFDRIADDVYRSDGIQSCPNSYKHFQQKDRCGKVVNGNIEDNFIQWISPVSKLIEYDDEMVEKYWKEKNLKRKPKPKPKRKDEKLKTDKKQVQTDELVELLCTEEDRIKFWDYANLIDKRTFVNRQAWLEFTFIHINVVGISDYDAYDKFCSTCAGEYVELNNRVKYEELWKTRTKRCDNIGWKSLYKIASDNQPEEKQRLDNFYLKPFNIHHIYYLRDSIENDNSGSDIEKEIEELENNNEIKTSIRNARIKQLKQKLKNHNKDNDQKLRQAKYMKMKYYFEQYHFKSIKPFQFVQVFIDDEDIIELYSKSTFRDAMDNILVDDKTPFTTMWFKDKQIKTYKNIDFIPRGKYCPDTTFNLFNGFKIERFRTNEKKSFDYILDALMLCSGDNEDMYNYLLKYIAHLIQNPAILPGVSLVIRGQQGTGKTSFWENLGKNLLGRKYLLQSTSPDHILGKFSSNHNKLLVMMEEVEGMTGFLNSSTIKGMITQETLLYEKKGKDRFEVNNCGRYIFISNGQNPVKIEPNDRRFVVMESSTRKMQDQEYFGKVMEQWNDPVVVRNLYDYFKSIDISEFNIVKDRVITEAYHEMQEKTVPIHARFLEDMVMRYRSKCDDFNPSEELSPTYYTKIIAIELYKFFKKFLERNGYEQSGHNISSFGISIKKYKGVTKKRNTKYIIYEMNMWNCRHTEQ